MPEAGIPHLEPEGGENYEPGEISKEARETIDQNTEEFENEVKNADSQSTEQLVEEFSTNVFGVDGNISNAIKENYVEVAENYDMTPNEVADVKTNFEEVSQNIIDADGKNIAEKMKNSSTFESLSKLKEKAKNGLKSLKKLFNKHTSGLLDSIKKLDPKVHEALVDEIMNDPEISKFAKEGVDVENQADIDKLKEKIKEKAERLAEDPEFNKRIKAKIEEIQAKNLVKDALSGKAERSWSLKDIYKLILSLACVAGIIGTLALLQDYALGHTGCMIIKNTGDSYETKDKVICYQDDGDNIDWAPQNCRCSESSPTDKIAITDKNKCSDGTTYPDKTSGSTNCKNYKTLEVPYVYYSYQVMSPLGAALDVTRRIVEQGGQMFDQIIKIAKVVGIIIGVLLVLLIIYNLVKSRSK